MAKKGHKIWVLSYCVPDWNDENIITIELSKKLLFFNTPFTFLQIFLKLRKIHKKIDVVHIPYTSNSLLICPILIAKKIYNIKYLITIHGGGMHQWKRKKIQKSFFSNAEKIIAVSQKIKEDYEKRTKRNIRVIPPLIPFKKSNLPKKILRQKYGFEETDQIILTLGSIKKIKGSDILLDAFFTLGLEYIKKYNLKLLYVGDGVMKGSLVEKVNDKSFSEYVKFFGNVNYEQVPDMYKLADIYVIPSLFEGTPITLLEAMYNQLPIIGSSTQGINNIISDGKNGLLFEKENSNDLKEKVITLIENEQLCKDFGDKAKETFDKSFNYTNFINLHLQLYNELLVKI